TSTVSGTQDLAGNTMSSTNWSFTTSAAAVTPPTVTGTSPGNGATNVAVTTTGTVTFSEAVQSATISVVLKDPTTNIIPGSTTYNDTTKTATFTPSAPLSHSTAYTATISGAQDLAGNTITTTSWSFTTTASTSTTYSIWTSSNTPGSLNVTD